MEHFKHSKPPQARAVVAPMNYRNDLIVFSFGNTGGPPLCVSVFNGLWFPTGHMIQCYLPPTRLSNPRWSVLSKQSQSWGVSESWRSKLTLLKRGEGVWVDFREEWLWSEEGGGHIWRLINIKHKWVLEENFHSGSSENYGCPLVQEKSLKS